jgi:protein-S-isoprenylcysteine O-methyltransferase Ste14
MSSLLSLSLVVAVGGIATVSHALLLVLGKRAARTSPARAQQLWRLHQLVNGSLWTILFVGIVLLQGVWPATAVTPYARVAGLVLFSSGLLMVGHARRLLGYERAMGVRFFFPERASWVNDAMYRRLNNPMYDGFVLVLLGAGMMFGIREDVWLALVSFILLNIFLARIENGPGKWNPL